MESELIFSVTWRFDMAEQMIKLQGDRSITNQMIGNKATSIDTNFYMNR